MVQVDGSVVLIKYATHNKDQYIKKQKCLKVPIKNTSGPYFIEKQKHDKYVLSSAQYKKDKAAVFNQF